MFLRIVRFHGVQGLAWSVLGERRDEIRHDIAAALADEAAAVAAENLRTMVACHDLNGDFDAAGVPILFVKGVTLGALSYGNATIKAAVDIDLLVAERQVADAARLLEQRGYELRAPRGGATEARLRSWHRLWKESVWVRPGAGSRIDLHTRLSDNRALLPSLDVHSPRQSVEVANGISLPTLATEELVAYLSVHGSSSAWFRLKWIADFAALLHGRGGEEIERLYRRSQELSAGRAAAQAMLLADALFRSLDDSPALRARLNKSAANRWLCRAALRELSGSAEPVEPTEHLLGTATIHLTQFGLLPGLKFKLSELARQFRVAFDRG